MRRKQFDYAVGHKVLVKAIDPNKLQPRAHGPYEITQVFTNGTVTIQRTQYVKERINIRRIIPFRT